MHTQRSHIRRGIAGLCLAACTLFSSAGYARPQAAPLARLIWLDALDLSQMKQEFGDPHAARSMEGKPLTLSGVVYTHGIGTHAASSFDIDLKGAATYFQAIVGLDDERKGQGSVVFQVFVDGEKEAETSVLHGGDAPVPLLVSLAGAHHLRLIVTDGGDNYNNDHADWADAFLTLRPGTTRKPMAISPCLVSTVSDIYCLKIARSARR